MEEKFKFKPSPFLCYENLTENSKEIYNQLEEKKFTSRSYK